MYINFSKEDVLLKKDEILQKEQFFPLKRKRII